MLQWKSLIVSLQTLSPDMNTTTWKLDPCVFGCGIVCGLEVHLDDNCNVHVSPGTAVTATGGILHVREAKKYQNYYKELPDPAVKKYFDHYNKYHNFLFWELAEGAYQAKTMDSLKAQFKSDNDPHPADEGHGTFLNDKILVVYVDESKPDPLLRFLLFRDDDVARLRDIDGKLANLMAHDKTLAGKTGIFSKNKKQGIDFDPEKIDRVLRPQLQLPELPFLRLGYKTLALVDDKYPIDRDEPPAGAELLDNLRNPYGAISSYNDLFQEYKSILDKAIPQMHDALTKLHEHFGPLVTHRDDKYLERFRSALARKWWAFKYGGEHLYYIQYYYDWVCDLGKAYRELRDALDDFSATCLCAEPSKDQKQITHLLLGPVMGGRTSYKPLIFRDYYEQPFTANNNEERLREIKCLHWRLMMMIWTFDLPFLHLEKKKYAQTEKPEPGAELKDSTDYWESIDRNLDKKYDLEDVPVKITPGYSLDFPLGRWAIPYYYPLDSDSPYSVHRFWDFHATKMNRVNTHLSFNANRGTDSYSRLPQVLFPLAYNIREYSFFRVEGMVGKKLKYDDKSLIYRPIVYHLLEIIKKYNLCIDVLAVDVSWPGLGRRKVAGSVTDDQGSPLSGVSVRIKGGSSGIITDVEGKFEVEVEGNAVLAFSQSDYIPLEISIGAETTVEALLFTAPPPPPPANDAIKVGPLYPNAISKLAGLERMGGVQPGQTLVLLYTSKDDNAGKKDKNGNPLPPGEQIELSECRRDVTPEVEQYTIVGDLTLPYRYSCCPIKGSGIEVIRQTVFTTRPALIAQAAEISEPKTAGKAEKKMPTGKSGTGKKR